MSYISTRFQQAHKTFKPWTLSPNRVIYTKLRRLVGGNKLKASLNPETISNSLLANSVQSLAEEDSLIVLHDPSDIRKRII